MAEISQDLRVDDTSRLLTRFLGGWHGTFSINVDDVVLGVRDGGCSGSGRGTN